MNEKNLKFIYDKSIRRPKRLQNNVFVLFLPERIRLQPGEVKKINMKLKIRLQQNLVDCCTLLQTFSDYGIKLLNSQHILSDSNTASLNQPIDLSLNLVLKVFNRNMNNIFQLKKKQEVGLFVILNDRGEEIRHYINYKLKKI